MTEVTGNSGELTPAVGSESSVEVRRDLPFLGLLSPEKTEAIMRGERVQITAEESSMFRAQMNLIHDRERERMRRGLQWMLNNLTGIEHEWAKEACNIARSALNGGA